MAPIEKVWAALVNPEMIEKWGAGPAKMSDKVGYEFSLWAGDIHGKNIEVNNPPKGKKRLVQEWYAGKWPEASTATFELTHKDGCTTIHFTHVKVPDAEFKDIDQGWDEHYLGKIKSFLES